MKVTINGCDFDYEFEPHFSTFPGGEVYVKLPIGDFPRSDSVDVVIEALPRSSDDIMRILMVNDAIRPYLEQKDLYTTTLWLHYLSYARQDRVSSKGESFSLRVMCELLETMDLSNLIIDDVHSDVFDRLYLGNLTSVPQHSLISSRARLGKIIQKADYLVAPDKGAAEKTKKLSELTKIPYIVCDKQRNSDGTIHVSCDKIIDPQAKLVVVDDICDGEGTFLAVGECFAENPMSLIVTHGIFSKGKDILLDRFTEVEAVHDWTTL